MGRRAHKEHIQSLRKQLQNLLVQAVALHPPPSLLNNEDVALLYPPTGFEDVVPAPQTKDVVPTPQPDCKNSVLLTMQHCQKDRVGRPDLEQWGGSPRPPLTLWRSVFFGGGGL